MGHDNPGRADVRDKIHLALDVDPGDRPRGGVYGRFTEDLPSSLHGPTTFGY
jgi:hypothetical protein